MSLDITAGQILGVPGEKLAPILGRISRKDAVALLTNKFIPFTISENIQKVFEEKAIKLGLPNPYEAAESALDGLRDVMDELSLDEPKWPDLTQLFNMAPARATNLDPLQQTPIGTPALNPQVYNRPSLTLNPVTGLTRAQTALLSPADQQYYMQRNRNRVT